MHKKKGKEGELNVQERKVKREYTKIKLLNSKIAQSEITVIITEAF